MQYLFFLPLSLGLEILCVTELLCPAPTGAASSSLSATRKERGSEAKRDWDGDEEENFNEYGDNVDEDVDDDDDDDSLDNFESRPPVGGLVSKGHVLNRYRQREFMMGCCCAPSGTNVGRVVVEGGFGRKKQSPSLPPLPLLSSLHSPCAGWRCAASPTGWSAWWTCAGPGWSGASGSSGPSPPWRWWRPGPEGTTGCSRRRYILPCSA